MEIKINNENYHTNEITKEEWTYVKKTKQELFKTYSKLNTFIQFEIKKKKYLLSKVELDYLIQKLILANLKYIKDIYSDKLCDKNQINKFVYKNMIKTFPYALDLNNQINMNRPYLYEPVNLITISLLYRMQAKVDKNIQNIKDLFHIYVMLLINNLVRSIKSSLIMFSIGDDIHGYSLFRGIIEQLAMIVNAYRNKDDFTEATTINRLLFSIDGGAELDEEAKITLQKFKDKYKCKDSNIEKIVRYGWCKTSKKPIQNSSDFIKSAFGSINDSFLNLYKVTSKLIHEDCIATPYDYVNMRIGSKDVLMFLTDLAFKLLNKAGISFNKEDNKLSALLLEFDSTNILNELDIDKLWDELNESE